jgi:hypothetical protein
MIKITKKTLNISYKNISAELSTHSNIITFYFDKCTKKTMTKKLLTCVVGANDVFIYHPEHNKNYDVHHKKKF